MRYGKKTIGFKPVAGLQELNLFRQVAISDTKIVRLLLLLLFDYLKVLNFGTSATVNFCFS